mmetsp:Transcript_49358/g.154571  ORF Transcript_49358/g.154571 Transcript_49358/m.154571 type:complete len:219 (+) Transcript_49358:336-992(+)
MEGLPALDELLSRVSAPEAAEELAEHVVVRIPQLDGPRAARVAACPSGARSQLDGALHEPLPLLRRRAPRRDGLEDAASAGLVGRHALPRRGSLLHAHGRLPLRVRRVRRRRIARLRPRLYGSLEASLHSAGAWRHQPLRPEGLLGEAAGHAPQARRLLNAARGQREAGGGRHGAANADRRWVRLVAQQQSAVRRLGHRRCNHAARAHGPRWPGPRCR